MFPMKEKEILEAIELASRHQRMGRKESSLRTRRSELTADYPKQKLELGDEKLRTNSISYRQQNHGR